MRLKQAFQTTHIERYFCLLAPMIYVVFELVESNLKLDIHKQSVATFGDSFESIEV